MQRDGHQNGPRERYEVQEHDVLIIGAVTKPGIHPASGTSGE